jgi:hypothetical protein
MIRPIFGTLLLLALVFAPSIAQKARDDLWASYRNYVSPYLAELPAGTGRPALSPRVVCVLVRGLRLEESRTLPTLQTLRQQGLDATVALAPPTYRAPSWVGLVSGATPDVHGITRNDTFLPNVDTIFKHLRAANKNAVVIGNIQWADWFGPDLARFEETGEVIEPDADVRDDAAINTAIQVLQDVQQPAHVVLIELASLDGLADAQPITTTQAISITPTPDPLALLDARLYRLISTLDLATNTVMVLSDRGRDVEGNDGGDDADVSRVPLVMAGAGVVPGTQDIVKQSAIAPMIAALLGAPMPTHAQGAPLIGALNFSQAQPVTASEPISGAQPAVALAPNAQLMLDSAQQRITFDEFWSEVNGQPRFAAESLQRYRIGIESGNVTAFSQLLAEIGAKREAAEAARLTSERLRRLPALIGFGLALVALVGLCLQKHPVQPFFGAALYYALWLLVFAWVRGHRFSLSMFANGMPQSFWLDVMRDSALLLGGMCLFVALATGRHKTMWDAAITVLSTLGLVACVPLGLLAWFYWQWGLAFTWVLPNSGLLAVVLIGLTQIAALRVEISPALPALPLAPVVALGSLLVHLVVRRKPRSGLYYERVKIR